MLYNSLLKKEMEVGSHIEFLQNSGKNRKNVKIPKTKTMGQCDTCLELKNLMQSGASKTEINQTIACHNQLHSSARTMFTQIRDRASQQPFNILSSVWWKASILSFSYHASSKRNSMLS